MKSNTLIIRIKGIIFGFITAAAFTWLQLYFSTSEFLENILGNSILVDLIRVVVSLFILMAIIGAIVTGLQQFFTGKDIFVSTMFPDDKKDNTDNIESNSLDSPDSPNGESDEKYESEIASRYSTMSDDELKELDPENLTDIARKCHQEEILSRKRTK